MSFNVWFTLCVLVHVAVGQSAARVINVITSQIPRVSSSVSGLTSRSIGNMLTVSPKTVQTTAGTVKVYTPAGGLTLHTALWVR